MLIPRAVDKAANITFICFFYVLFYSGFLSISMAKKRQILLMCVACATETARRDAPHNMFTVFVVTRSVAAGFDELFCSFLVSRTNRRATMNERENVTFYVIAFAEIFLYSF